MSWSDGLIVAVLLWFPIAFAAGAVRAASGSESPVWVLRDRSEVITGTAECLAVLAVGRGLGPWDVVPPAVWGLALGLAVLGLLLGLRAWPQLPWLRDPGPARRLAVGVDLLVSVVLVALVV